MEICLFISYEPMMGKKTSFCFLQEVRENKKTNFFGLIYKKRSRSIEIFLSVRISKRHYMSE